MTIREVLNKESKTLDLIILHSNNGYYEYWSDPDCLIYNGQEEIGNIEDKILNLSVVAYDAIRSLYYDTLTIVWI